MADLKAATIATDRFGFGPRQTELTQIAFDPRGWLKAQLSAPNRTRAVPRSSGLLVKFLQAREKKADLGADPMFRKELREAFKAASGARTLAAASSDQPFQERLVQFWSNHFTVSIQRPVVIPTAMDFEEQAIRPNVLGRFSDMLRAVASHPAMLLYLDNAISVGPDSRGGRLRDKGLNENLAREILELHTLGVDGGYSQGDVTEFAKILTGWSINRANDPNPGTFRFRPAIHQPGSKTLLGHTYREDGDREGAKALDDLAAHPATAHHIATKLARHFVADDPPASAVDHLTSVFRKTGGDLRALSAALIELPEIWNAPQAKIKTPNDLVISAFRAFGLAGPQFGDSAVGGLGLMGQLPFNAPSPAGWPDTATAWISPESMMTRIEWALAAGKRLDGHADPREVVRATIPDASERTLSHIDRAPSQAEALALLIVSPEFQRR